MCFFVQTNHTRKELLFLMFKEINLRNHSSLHKLFYSLGKSTLVKLLVDFFSPIKGKVTFNNYSTKEINKHVLRSYVNYVPQTPYVCAGTIKENLLLGSRSNITEEDIAEACQIAEIKNDIEKLPLGFDTQLDENAKILSGGTKTKTDNC